MRRVARTAPALLAVGAVLLSACSVQEASGQDGGTAKPKRVVYVSGVKAGAYHPVACGMQEVAKRTGVELEVQEPDTFSPTAQIPLVNAAVASRPDALVISATDTKALVGPLKQAAAQGIKVFTVANSVADESFLSGTVVGENRQNGVLTADLLAKLTQGRSGDVAYIGYQRGGSAITDARQDGFESQLKRYPSLRYLGATVANGIGDADGAAAANAILSAHPNLLAIVGSYLNVSLGMAQTLRERGLADKVVALQMDSDEKGVSLVRDGTLKGLVGERFREEGVLAMEQAVNAITGKPVQSRLTTEPVVFTQENADDPKMAPFIVKYTGGC